VDAVLLFAVSIVVTLLWFNNGSLALGGDYASIPFDPVRTASRYLSSWNFWIDGGNAIPSAISNQVTGFDFLFYYTLHMANIPVNAAQGAYIVLFVYFLPAICTYLLVIVLFESKIGSIRLAGFVAGMFAILNPTYVYSSGYTAILNSPVPRASLPLALFLLVAGFKKRDLRYALALGLSSVLLFEVFARAIEFGFLILIATFLAAPYMMSFVKDRPRGSLKFVFSFLGVSSIVAIAANLYWLVPFLGLYQVFYVKLVTFPVSFVSFESQFTTLQNVLRLQGYWPFFVGNYVPYAGYYFNLGVWIATFAIPVVALGGLYVGRFSRPQGVSLGILLALLLALSLGTNLPFGIFSALIQSVPFFKLYKDPWIFLEPLSLLYSILFGVSIALLAGFLAKHVRRRYIPRITSLALAMFVLGVISLPILSGAVFVNWYQPSQRGVAVPPQYAQLNEWLSQDNCGCATMIIPKLSGSYVATSWGFQGANELYQNILSPRLITGSGPAIYGLQASPEKDLLDYVYTLMSKGNPVFSPKAINATAQTQSWHFSVKSQMTVDIIGQQQTPTPWNEPALVWNFGPLSEGTQNGHAIYFRFNSTQDFSRQRWALIWAYSSNSWSKVVFGIGDNSGNVAWYPFDQHELFARGEWKLFGFPLTRPDVSTSNLSRTTSFFLNYGLFLGQEEASAGNGSVGFGPISVSTGFVPEEMMQFLLARLNVKYLVMDQSIDSNLYPQLDTRSYESMLSLWPQISLVRTFGTLLVYENYNFGSLISIPDNWIHVPNLYLLPEAYNKAGLNTSLSGFIVGEGPNLNVTTSSASLESVRQTGPTSFTVQLSGTGNIVVVLSTAFDPNWEATYGGRIIGNHMLANGYANGWSLNGSGNMTIQLNYLLQTPYEASLWSSLLSIISVSVIIAGRKLVAAMSTLRHSAIFLNGQWRLRARGGATEKVETGPD
jgi:hypothetical protein